MLLLRTRAQGSQRESKTSYFFAKNKHVLFQLSHDWPARRQDMFSFSRGQQQGDETCFFILQGQPAWRRDMFFISALLLPRSLLGLCFHGLALVRSWEHSSEETRYVFYFGLRQIKNMSRLDRGGARLPGDDTCFLFRGPAKYYSSRHDFSARKIKNMSRPK